MREENPEDMAVKIIFCLVMVWLAYVLTGCSTVPSTPQVEHPAAAPPPPVSDPEPKKYVADWDAKHPEWTLLLRQALFDNGKALLKDDGRCDPMQFFVLLISTMSRFESNHSATVTYTENFRDNQGNLIVSRGPLQVSKESCNGYGAGIKDEKELHDPYTNFRCAVLILNKWIPLDGTVADGKPGAWRGGARYWSVLRDVTKREIILGRAKEACK